MSATRKLSPDLLLLFLSLLLFSAQAFNYIHHSPYDDACITFRYATNLVEGHGPVFNLGERVEGYTNFLWMVILAGVSLIGLAPPQASVLLGILCGLCTLLVVYVWGNSILPASPTRGWVPRGGLAALLLALMHPFAFHSVMGLETALFALLVTAGFASYLREGGKLGWSAAMLFLGCALTRPEGILFAGVVAVHFLVSFRREDRRGWRILLPGLVAACLYGLFLIWRIRYYGHLLPNTYYAKQAPLAMDARTGLAYLAEHLLANLGILTLLAGGFLLLRRRSSPFLTVTVAVLVLFSLYVVKVGGDHFPEFRFFVPLLPLSVMLTAFAAAELAGLVSGRDRFEEPPRANRPWVLLAVQGSLVLAFFLASFLPGLSGAEEKRGDYELRDRKWTFIGQKLKQVLPPGTTIGLSAVGAIPYYSGLPTVDILGLTDAHIARVPADVAVDVKGHQKHDADYVLSRRPDYLILNNGDIVTNRYGSSWKWLPSFRVDPTGIPLPGPTLDLGEHRFRLIFEADIVQHPDFKQYYRPVMLPLQDGYHLFCWGLISDEDSGF